MQVPEAGDRSMGPGRRRRNNRTDYLAMVMVSSGLLIEETGRRQDSVTYVPSAQQDVQCGFLQSARWSRESGRRIGLEGTKDIEVRLARRVSQCVGEKREGSQKYSGEIHFWCCMRRRCFGKSQKRQGLMIQHKLRPQNPLYIYKYFAFSSAGCF